MQNLYSILLMFKTLNKTILISDFFEKINFTQRVLYEELYVL